MALRETVWVHDFSDSASLGRDALGGKGYGLAVMTGIGLPVPPGFTITTDACRRYREQGRLPDGLMDEVQSALKDLEGRMKRRLGDPLDPLLVSVRSGAPISMPGMMDTILNLGLNRSSVEGLASRTGDGRFAYDSYRRLIQMFGNVVLGIDMGRFEEAMDALKQERHRRGDQDLSAEDLRDLCETYRTIVEEQTGRPFPEDPSDQLATAIAAVFESWNNPRAQVYRSVHHIPDDMGTAVNVQAMVFGNRGDTSGTGVLFTRDPNTGEPVLTGEYLMNAQGEDVVAGLRTPRPIATLRASDGALYSEIERVARELERHFGDVQDIEFTVETGRLYLLQTRSAKRSAAASVRIAVDMVHDGVLGEEDAVMHVSPDDVQHLLHRTVDPRADLEEAGRGLPGSPGAATGRVVFSAEEAVRWHHRGERVMLVRPETTPEDIHGIVASEGVLTARGGMTSHAAIVARGMGKAAVVGCDGLRVNMSQRTAQLGGHTIGEGDLLSIDGGTGRIFRGAVPMTEAGLGDEVRTLLGWADKARRLGVEANADTPEDAARARAFGADGIGLCRTEHMFMDPARLPVVREMILAETADERAEALERLLPMQQQDFEGIFRAMDGCPVTIRLLDPPLHEFLPDVESLATEIAVLEARGLRESQEYAQKKDLLRKARALSEKNPMLGFRGCRLGIVHPEIYEMQARAIVRAALTVMGEGHKVHPEIMIPLVGDANELSVMRSLVEKVHREETTHAGTTVAVHIGTMIEVPRACLRADDIARHADFFSFGTNDLTQTTFGLSRDDAEGKFLTHYIDRQVYPADPFVVLDEAGVGALIEIGITRGRRVKPHLQLGICGEHGGEPTSIDLCHRLGLDYVSCSPYRVPIARLSAGQAALRRRGASQEA